MKTTIPYNVEYINGLHKPVFTQIPTEQDFNISTSKVTFPDKASVSIRLDFGIIQLELAKSERKSDKYYLTHVSSRQEPHTLYGMGSGEWDTLIDSIKSLIKAETNYLKSETAYLERLIK